MSLYSDQQMLQVDRGCHPPKSPSESRADSDLFPQRHLQAADQSGNQRNESNLSGTVENSDYQPFCTPFKGPRAAGLS